MDRQNLYRIALVDKHPMMVQWVRKILENEPGLAVVATLSDGHQLLAYLEQADPPHMVVLDISMPGLSGIEATRHLQTHHPDIKILILTMHKGKDYLSRALDAGAHGYLLKQDADQHLLPAIASLRQGRTFLSPLLAV